MIFVIKRSDYFFFSGIIMLFFLNASSNALHCQNANTIKAKKTLSVVTINQWFPTFS